MRQVFRLLVLFSLCLLIFLHATSAADDKEHEIAAATRGDQSRFVHRIQLLDHDGKPIAADSAAPYSPKKTCGHCHKQYDVINHGTHSQMFPGKGYDAQNPPAHVWSVFDHATHIQAPVAIGFYGLRNEKAVQSGAKPVIPLTTFDLAVQFGGFHPGGGRFETDAEGRGYEETLAGNPKLRSEANPDYYESRWDQSGALEIDCMVCHALKGYDHAERAAQIAVMNFKWAPTVGMGLGTVKGNIVGAPRPEPGKPPASPVAVKYNPSLFDPEGKVHMDIGPPPDRNCLFCHRRRATQDTGWQDSIEGDIHCTGGLHCVDCHPAGLNHVIPGPATVAQNPGYASLACEGCHTAGRLGAPSPLHRGLPDLHLKKIRCETCHSGPLPRLVPARFEQPTDPLWSAIIGSTKPSGPTVWAPVFARDSQGKIGPFVRMIPEFFAEKTDAGLIPLMPKSIFRTYFRTATKGFKDDDGDGAPEINSDEEVQAILTALKKNNPVFHYGGSAYSLNDKSELQVDAGGAPIDRPFAHNVRFAAQSLGASGCTDCHRTDSPFFLSIAPVRPIGKDGKPEGQTLLARCGRSEFDLWLGAVRERLLKPYAPLAVILFVLAMAAHYVLFGPRRHEMAEAGEEVARFSPVERLTHLVLLVSFSVLAITGLSAAMGVNKIITLAVPRVHTVAAAFLVIGFVLTALLWIKDMRFFRDDLVWVRHLGGYLGGRRDLPARRFNAGQKAFFWFIGAIVICFAATGVVMAFGRPGGLTPLAYTLHDLCAYLMLLGIVAHAYLGTLANPGTLRGIFEGKVSKAWLRHHHPDHPVKDEE
ncbi:MAG: cytochrome b/b6 domain-containing protein [Planctomycetota bacterium]